MALIFGNFAISDLAAPLNPGDTSMTVALGTGSLFPSPTGADYFVIVLTDVATKANHEVVWCTARSGDNLTIVRAKEGTTAQSWIVSDLCYVGPTNGQMAAMAQTAGAEFTGQVLMLTQAVGNNTTRGASTAFVQGEFADRIPTSGEAIAGSNNTKTMTPLRVQNKLDSIYPKLLGMGAFTYGTTTLETNSVGLTMSATDTIHPTGIPDMTNTKYKLVYTCFPSCEDLSTITRTATGYLFSPMYARAGTSRIPYTGLIGVQIWQTVA